VMTMFCDVLFLCFYSYPTPSVSSLLSFFFFYSSGHHRHLHSFPTRRSSDLSTCGGVRIFSGRPAPTSTSQVASTTSIPIPSPGSTTTVFVIGSGLLSSVESPRRWTACQRGADKVGNVRARARTARSRSRSEEHTSELQ